MEVQARGRLIKRLFWDTQSDCMNPLGLMKFLPDEALATRPHEEQSGPHMTMPSGIMFKAIHRANLRRSR